ncbi:MAG: NAD(P)/FAD-dependent oxidoreductase [Clostridia bacterium]|nr:NAD(P)/FAD-dependent oxidoreductase [Clostridia bacterium]
MNKRLENLKLKIGESENKLLEIARKKAGNFKSFKIIKKSLDARDKSNICWVYSVAVSDEAEQQKPELEKLKNPPKVAVIGSGPAGLFCALRLVEHGFAPVIIERGECVEERKRTTQTFFENGRLDENSNVQFGEGGAGTFSDGKLNTQTHDGLNRDVLSLFKKFGAPEEVTYLNKPHIGSDKLYGVLQNIRKYIEENGGRYFFNTAFTGFTQKNGTLKTLRLKNVKTGEESEMQVDCAVLAVGHSARDTFKMLANSEIQMQAREFALGVRIEHLASEIGFAQYGKSFKQLPAADYKLVSRAHERTVFTFCMCPGGVVIPAASEEGGVVTNGMSLYSRCGENSNSALMVQMKQEDFGSDDLFAGMEFQRAIERTAYDLCGKNYSAPVQLYGDFARSRVSDSFKSVKPTYSAGTSFVPLDRVLPKITVEALKAAIPDMDKRLKGFASPDAVLTGVETRFSSPVRILRTESGESVSLNGLYPCGEGSGYSGGITSSAADGLKTAELIFEKYKNH